MSPRAEPVAAQAAVFAALGDETRLALVRQLSQGEPCSITRLTDGAGVTRQAISKHLRVLEQAGIVRAERLGRETLFALETERLRQAQAALDRIAAQWDDALARLKRFVEDEPPRPRR